MNKNIKKLKERQKNKKKSKTNKRKEVLYLEELNRVYYWQLKRLILAFEVHIYICTKGK